MHPHSAGHYLGYRNNVSSRLKQQAASSRSNRYRVSAARRAAGLEQLDANIDTCVKDTSNNGKSEQHVMPSDCDESGNISQSSASSSCDQIPSLCSGTSAQAASPQTSPVPDPSVKTAHVTDHVKEDKMFCIFDVESEEGELDRLIAQQVSLIIWET